MKKYSLNADKRSVQGKKVKLLRKLGKLPANIYGKHVKSISVEVSQKEFSLLFSKAGETGLIEISMDSKIHPVLIHKVQYHPLTRVPLHADFMEVNLKEKVITKVPVVLIGEAQAVKDKAGVLLQLLNDIEVEALPTDLPEKIEVDVTALKAIDDVIKLSVVKLPAGVLLKTDPTHDVVKVAPLVSKEAEKMAAEAAAVAAAAAAASAASAVPAEGATVAPASPTPATAGTPSKSAEPSKG